MNNYTNLRTRLKTNCCEVYTKIEEISKNAKISCRLKSPLRRKIQNDKKLNFGLDEI